jgi:hypothetical protein
MMITSSPGALAARCKCETSRPIMSVDSTWF